MNSEQGAGCSDTGSGTQAHPFCTIAAAAAVVQPGQTVLVEPQTYQSTTISVSGTASAPITFLAENGPFGVVRIEGNGFVISGAHNVVVRGFISQTEQPYLIENSSDITLSGGYAQGLSLSAPSIEITGTSSNVTISRLAISARGPDNVQIDQGATGAVVTANTILASKGPAVAVTGAPGTDVVGNTLVTDCNPGVVVSGSSPGTSLENNIAETAKGPVTAPSACASPGNATAFSVSAASTPQTTADYNLTDPASGGPLYNWAGTDYSSLASFAAATGQGEHDIAASPGLTGIGGACGTIFCFPLSPNSPAIDSADANAPGETATDELDNPRADDPSVPDTGTGAGYYDRGAIELEGPIDNGSLTVRADPADGPLSVSASAPMTTTWITNGSIGVEAFYFSDTSLPDLTGATTAGVSHTFGVAGAYEVEVLEGLGDFFEPGYQTQTTLVVVGADYTPVAPTRILDTRSGIGAAEAPIPPGAKLILEIPDIGQVSASDLSAIAVNVTVTDPAAAGSVTVYTQSGAGAATSNVNFSKGQSIADLVTIKPAGTDVTLQNNSSGTVQVVADLDGYYSNSGSGFQPVSPVRVLDTRNRTGTTAPGPVPSHAVVRLNLSGKVPAGTTAAVLNLTATGPTAPGFVTAYADGQPLPGASSLNFAARQTIPNLVIVPLTGDVADLYNGSSGTVQLVADLDGYFDSEAASTFVPYGPLRIVDTRVGLGTAVVGAVPARGTLVITPNAATGATAAVLNVAVTQAKAAGYLTVYPHNGSLPASSNVNFSAGQTVANLVMVPMANGQVAIYNGSSGSVQIIVDEQGYYISQP